MVVRRGSPVDAKDACAGCLLVGQVGVHQQRFCRLREGFRDLVQIEATEIRGLVLLIHSDSPNRGNGWCRRAGLQTVRITALPADTKMISEFYSKAGIAPPVFWSALLCPRSRACLIQYAEASLRQTAESTTQHNRFQPVHCAISKKGLFRFEPHLSTGAPRRAGWPQGIAPWGHP